MQKITYLFLALALPLFAFTQNGPIDFEPNGEGANWNWTVFENDTNPALQIIPNPDPTGLNPSATVAKFTALQAGNPWAGCESLHGAGTGSFFIDSSNYLIRIMVWKSEISDVGIKLVRPDAWSLGEIKVANTKVNEWEQITFDFSAHIGLTQAYDQVVIFPDFQTRTSDQVIYFDNVFSGPAFLDVEEEEIQTSKLYPNPGSSEFHIESQTLIEGVKIFDLTGSLIKRVSIKGFSIDIDASDFAKGVYLIHVEKGNKTEVLRWVKQY